jgi:hypothetical protein
MPTILEPVPAPTATGGTSAVYPTNFTGTQPAAKKSNSMMMILGGLGVGILLFVILVAVGVGAYLNSHHLVVVPVFTNPTALQERRAIRLSETPTPAIVASATTAQTQAPAPALAGATPIPLVTDTMPPLYVRIDSITIAANKYVVQYETFGFVDKLPFMHVHFFFNNVAPEEAGVPGAGPWMMYGGVHPFRGYSVSQRPEGVSQMCALVANPNHTVIAGSGNCVNLP